MSDEIKIINLGFVNAYLIKTKKGFILIDTGFTFKRNLIEAELEKAGVTPGNLKLIVLTHGDRDHSGNSAYLRKKYKSRIAMHKADTELVKSDKINSNRKIKSPVFWLMSQIMFPLFINPKLKKYPFEKFMPDMFLKEGQSLSSYGLDARVIHLPGHTFGSIAIMTIDGLLFSGDIVSFMNKKIKPSFIVANSEDLVVSVEKLKKLPVKTVYPGHGKPFHLPPFTN